jgi:hypothetical protein
MPTLAFRDGLRHNKLFGRTRKSLSFLSTLSRLASGASFAAAKSVRLFSFRGREERILIHRFFELYEIVNLMSEHL